MKYLFFLLIIPFYVGAQNLSQNVEAISQLRQEVELLSTEIESFKKLQQSEMDVYIQRHQEVSSQVLKEKFRQDQLLTQIKLSKDKVANHSKNILNKGSENWLKNFWDMYEKSLDKAHPLYSSKLKERISKLKVDFAFKKISYEHALLQTWFVLETDLNKSQDAEFLLSPFQFEDKLYHVEMVRLGRTSGYFRTSDGQYGLLTLKEKWQLEFFEDQASRTMIETLLTQFKQQQKTGLFTLPGMKI